MFIHIGTYQERTSACVIGGLISRQTYAEKYKRELLIGQAIFRRQRCLRGLLNLYIDPKQLEYFFKRFIIICFQDI